MFCLKGFSLNHDKDQYKFQKYSCSAIFAKKQKKVSVFLDGSIKIVKC